MNFQQLDYALAIHKHKNFGAAADYCDISQATLSAMVKKLEQELDIVLFDRSRKPVKTTAEGMIFIEKARSILKIKGELNEIKNSDSSMEGKLTIGIIPTVVNALMPKVLPKILDENPKINLEIKEITTEQIKLQLSNDEIDLGILATPIQDEEYDEHQLYYEPMWVYGIQNEQKHYVSSDDVKNQNIWLLEEGHCFREQMRTICEIKEKAPKHKNLAFKSNSFETLMHMCDQFGGLTLLPELFVNQLPPQLQLKSKSFTVPIPVREISIVSYRKTGNQKIISYLSQLIQKEVSPLLKTSQYKKHELEIIGIA